VKYLLVLVVVLVAVYVWKQSRRRDDAPAPPPRPRADATPALMVACRHCGTHLPQADALPGQSGAHYCSAEHRRAQHDDGR